MSILRGVARQVLPPARLIGGAGWSIGVTTVYLTHRFLAPRDKGHGILEFHKQIWGKGLCRIAGARVILDPGPPAPATRARFIVSNHRTLIDVPLITGLFGGAFLARGDMSRWPIAAYAIRSGETIFVDRKDPDSRAASVREMRRRLSLGHTVSVFSEGTTFPGDEVRPFRSGGFTAVEGLDVDLVPVGIAYPPNCEFTQKRFLDHMRDLTGRVRIPVAICIGDALPADGDAEELARRMHAEVQRLVHRARTLLDR